ncbi:hypothetical protein [Microtetraspora niveoalba]|uniref:hypothetical protein n=1 Tax=Microtetraspora niveoalba TaxID=46175 RepID=UPI0012FC3088|nr:hypothetical protein [Microtetraspora niveoalba]
MRTAGIGVLGLIGGLLFAIVLQDILARALTDADGTPSVLGMILGSLLPAFALLGAVLAVWLDRRHRRTRSKDTTDD